MKRTELQKQGWKNHFHTREEKRERVGDGKEKDDEKSNLKIPF